MLVRGGDWHRLQNFLTRPQQGTLYSLGTDPGTFTSNHLQSELIMQYAFCHILLKSGKPENMPPEQTLELIVLVLCLQHRDVGQGVVGDPEPVGQAIGDHHVDGVVTPGQQQQDHPGNTGQQRQPVQRVQPVRGVWGKQVRTD